jgi:hypothetical protein
MSDLARQFPAATAPGLYSGSAVSNAAGSGMPEVAGQEKATGKNSSLSHDYRDDRTK